jgi:hypothetical protein
MEVRGQLHVPAILCPRRNPPPRPQLDRGLAGLRFSLNVVGNNTGRESSSEVQCPLKGAIIAAAGALFR